MALRRVPSLLGSAVLLFSVLQVGGANYGSTIKRVLDLYNNKMGQKLRIVNLKYEQCGPESDPGHLNKLEIMTSPEGDAIVTLSASTDVDVQSPVKVTVDLYKRLFGSWIKIPCIGNIIGSCVHDDICQYGFDECPFESLRRAKVPCHCPIAKGTYTLNQTEIPVPPLPRATVIVGDYKARVVARVGDTQLACYAGSGTVEAYNPDLPDVLQDTPIIF